MAVNATVKADKSQERFYDALRELFVGAKVEGRFPQHTEYSMQHTGVFVATLTSRCLLLTCR
jgi:hypothetical protein